MDGSYLSCRIQERPARGKIPKIETPVGFSRFLSRSFSQKPRALFIEAPLTHLCFGEVSDPRANRGPGHPILAELLLEPNKDSAADVSLLAKLSAVIRKPLPLPRLCKPNTHFQCSFAVAIKVVPHQPHLDHSLAPVTSARDDIVMSVVVADEAYTFSWHAASSSTGETARYFIVTMPKLGTRHVVSPCVWVAVGVFTVPSKIFVERVGRGWLHGWSPAGSVIEDVATVHLAMLLLAGSDSAQSL